MTSSFASSTTTAVTGNTPLWRIAASAKEFASSVHRDGALLPIEGLPVEAHPAIKNDVEAGRGLLLQEQHCIAPERSDRAVVEQSPHTRLVQTGEDRQSGNERELRGAQARRKAARRFSVITDHVAICPRSCPRSASAGAGAIWQEGGMVRPPLPAHRFSRRSRYSLSATALLCSVSLAPKTRVTRPVLAVAMSCSSAARTLLELPCVTLLELVPLRGIVPEPLSEAGARRQILEPGVDLEIVLGDAPRPDPVDQHAVAIALGRSVVGALQLDRHRRRQLPMGAVHRSIRHQGARFKSVRDGFSSLGFSPVHPSRPASLPRLTGVARSATVTGERRTERDRGA